MKKRSYEWKREREMFLKDFIFILFGILIALIVQILVGLEKVREILYSNDNWIVIVSFLIFSIIILIFLSSYFHFTKIKKKYEFKIEKISPKEVAKLFFDLHFKKKLYEWFLNDDPKELVETENATEEDIENVKEETKLEVNVKEYPNYTKIEYDNSDEIMLYKNKIIFYVNSSRSFFTNPYEEIKEKMNEYKRDLRRCRVNFIDS